MPRSQDERERLSAAYLRYLDHIRLPDAEDEARFAELMQRAETNPHEEAWDELETLIFEEPDDAWQVALTVLARCDEKDLAMIGVSVLGALLRRQPEHFADRFEKEILTSPPFFQAFQHAAMTGVPLAVQQKLNAALLVKGLDARLVVEYDEDPEGEP